MLTPFLIASQAFVLQSLASGPEASPQRQDAVLVVHEGKSPSGEDLVFVSTPISVGDGAPVSLAELRDAARKSQAAILRAATEFTVDETLGGRPKHAKDGSDSGGGDSSDGGIAGGPPQSDFDLVFQISSTTVIPNSIATQFYAALASIERYFESQILTATQVRIRMAYVQLSPGRLGMTSCRYAVKPIPQVFAAVNGQQPNDGDDVQSTPVSTTLPTRYSGISISVTPEDRVYVTQALQKALGIYAGSGLGELAYDGVITLNNSIQWDFDPSNGLMQGTTYLYSFQDAIVRELMQVLGTVAGADFLTRDCTVMDFSRFQQDVISPALVVVDPATMGAPPPSCSDVNDDMIDALVGGGHLPGGHALDYNPGLNKDTIAAAAALAPPVTAIQLMTAVGGGTAPPPELYLIYQMRGLLDSAGTPLTPEQGNTFDDARLPTTVPTEITAFPDGATQTVVPVNGGARCAFVDYQRSPYNLGGIVTQVNFFGACPRLVARNSPSDGSILNFLQDTARDPDDFELRMYDGTPIRGIFVIQDELAELSTRCLMGRTMSRGVTWYSRDPLAIPPYSVPLGALPDFLTKREWLILDSMGWAVNASGALAIDATTE
ncbi:MAG: hypothetical protein EXS03_01135 [Phycisphaerales bacterium]|nr:hypothetical protein [Phycisphaerales bacterium]